MKYFSFALVSRLRAPVRNLLLTTGLVWAGAVTLAAEPRPDSLEERLDRVESNLERLIALLAAALDETLDEDVKDQLQTLAAELKTIRREALQVEQPAAELAVAEAEPVSVEEAMVVAEVVAVPDASDATAGFFDGSMPMSGYMEMHVNHDGLNPTTLDFHRFVLNLGHMFGDRIRFWSELEIEHGFIEGGAPTGELELEQAFLDFLIDPRFNFRAGILLTPVGIINERHEPTAFHGVERPFVDEVILPTTWFGAGGGLVGDLGSGFSYKTYVMSSMDGSFFSAEEGFRDGRQKAFLENARNLAWVGRVEYGPFPGLNLGTSVWTGETGFHLRDLDARLRIFEFDGRYRYDRFEARGQFAVTHLDQASEVNAAIRRNAGINPNIAQGMRGFYLEGSSSLVPAGFSHDVVGFYRYENFDTQHRMPDGFFPLSQFDRSAHVLGLSYFPHPDVVLKVDYNFMRNASRVVRARNRWNLGFGWWF